MLARQLNNLLSDKKEALHTLGLTSTVFDPSITDDPLQWWEQWGTKMPQLQDVALRLLCIPATAAGGERTFSVFSGVWRDDRSRLMLGRVGMIAYVYYNSRMIQSSVPIVTAADWDQFAEWVDSLPCTVDVGKKAAQVDEDDEPQPQDAAAEAVELE